MTDIRDRAIQIYDAFTHEHRDRRTLLREMAALAGSAAAAEMLIAGIAASPAAASITDPADKRLDARSTTITLSTGKTMKLYSARPRELSAKAGLVMVIHENRGLTPHIQDVARRVALAGFAAVAPDFLSDQGGTPDNEDKARDLIAAANYDSLIAEGTELIASFQDSGDVQHKVGIVGFCWGGGLVDRLAIAAGDTLAAAVAYYGPAPDPSEAAKVKAPMLLHYAGKDTRVAATGGPWVAALKAAGKDVADYTYPGVDHAFNNDTSPDRYNAGAAKLAWERTIAFFHAHLDG